MRSVVRRPAQFSYRERGDRRTVIKEVNPLVLPWIIENFDVRVIYLVCHPVAVANSYEPIPPDLRVQRYQIQPRS